MDDIAEKLGPMCKLPTRVPMVMLFCTTDFLSFFTELCLFLVAL
jgi:hypothetical protein